MAATKKKPKVACNAKPKRNRNELELTFGLPACFGQKWRIN